MEKIIYKDKGNKKKLVIGEDSAQEHAITLRRDDRRVWFSKIKNDEVFEYTSKLENCTEKNKISCIT